LTTAQIPSHTHSGTTDGVGDHAHSYGGGGETLGPGNGTISEPFYSLTTGGAGAHSHTFTTNASGGGGSHDHGFTGTAMDFAVQYIDIILCSKN
jgi:hypothetical protein